MNRILPLLVCCLMLWGCSPAAPDGAGVQETQSVPVPQAVPLKPQTYYDGALQVFSPGLTSPSGLYAMGEDLLILSGEDTTTLTLLSGDDLTPLSHLTLSFSLSPTDPSLRVGSSALSCYDPIHKQTLVLDSALREVSHIPAPEDLQGVPILSSDRNILYYCTPEGIRAWNLETGLRRQVKEMTLPGQSLTGLALDDTVLQCTIPEEDRTTLLSAQTGGLLFDESGNLQLTGESGWYCVSLSTPLKDTYIFGEALESPMLFLPEDASSQCFFLTNHPGAVTCTTQGDHRLDYYDLLTGHRTSSLILGSDLAPIAITDTPSGDVYLLTEGPTACFLCRWEISPDNALSLEEETTFLFPYQKTPDPSSLSQCQACASRLSSRLGIRILIGDAATRIQPWDFRLEPETQPGILLRELQDLEERLSVFPSVILTETASHFTSLNLCIVRSVTGTAESGSQEKVTGVQFLDGTDAYVVITAGKYSEGALYRQLFQAMQTHILTNSSAFDQWSKLNPQDFSYTYGGPPEENSLWLTGENQVILDPASQTFPKEDRSRIFEAALLSGNKETFRPWILQRKLTAICKGIREAYGLTKSPAVYPWEQYLDSSLAYKG